MYDRLKRLYQVEKRLDMDGLINAVNKRLITEDQFFDICGVTFDEATGNKAGEGSNATKEVNPDE